MSRQANSVISLPSARWARFRWGQSFGCYVTKFAPHRALKLIVSGKLTFDERVVLHRVKWRIRGTRNMRALVRLYHTVEYADFVALDSEGNVTTS